MEKINWDYVMYGFFILVFAGIAIMIGVTESSNPSSPSSDTRSTPYVSNGEFDHAYGQFRGSGMNENEAGAAARATTNFLNNQRASQAAEANRQR
jgi:hypothetical protein